MRDITYCLSCKKDMINIDPKVTKAKNNKRVISSKYSVCNNKKTTFISQGSGLFELFESSCSHLNFRFRACFEQGVP